MKRNYFFLIAFLFGTIGWQVNAQAVNEPANWPNANWVLDVIEHTGSDPQDIEADPTTAANFAYDDDDTGSGSHDVIAAESPVIDLTAAQAAGENYIIISGEYVYNNINNDEYLAIEYWDADAGTWSLFYQFPNADTPSAPTDNYCTATPVSYVTNALDISGFTATQLSGFKYRFIYNDNTTGGDGWRWGFCFSSPTISSSSVVSPIFSLSLDPDCANSQFNVIVDVTDLGGSNSVTVADDQGSTSQQLSAPGQVTFGPYASGTTVNFTVTSDDNSISATDMISYICPPVNDDITGAIPITPSPAGTGCSTPTFQAWTAQSGVTDSGMDGSCNGTNTGLDVFYTWTATSDELLWSGVDGGPGIIIRDTSGNEITCEQTLQTDSVLSGWNIGDDLIIQIYDYAGYDVDVSFCLELHGNIQSVSDNQIAGFKFYPNPVNNTLNISAKDNIEAVSITNVMGQEVLRVSPEATQTQIDMSHLQNGVYFVKAQVNGEMTAFKVIKK